MRLRCQFRLARFQRGLAAFVALVMLTAGSAHAERAVDLELVLAVDVSMSMDFGEQKLQREGYVSALRDPQVIRAITDGALGRIALTYVEWAGSHIQSVVIPWREINSAATAEAFAAELENRQISRARRTSISTAISMSASLFEESGFAGRRRVIDVSGDGPNNGGRPVVPVRDEALAKGIIINGLAIMLPRTSGAYSFFDIPDLDRYYAACVIGGPGSFVLPIKTRAEFATATRQKLLLEIAGLMPGDATPGKNKAPSRAPTRQRADLPVQLHHAQFKLTVPKPAYDCLIGEKMWQRYMEERWE